MLFAVSLDVLKISVEFALGGNKNYVTHHVYFNMTSFSNVVILSEFNLTEIFRSEKLFDNN